MNVTLRCRSTRTSKIWWPYGSWASAPKLLTAHVPHNPSFEPKTTKQKLFMDIPSLTLWCKPQMTTAKWPAVTHQLSHKLRGFHSSPLQRCGDCEQLLDSPAVPNGVNWTEWTAQIFTQLRQRSTAHHHWGERSVSTQTHIRVTSASSSAATHRSQRTGLLKTPVAH